MVTTLFRFDDGPPRLMLRLQREQRTNSRDGVGKGEDSEHLEAPLSERAMVIDVDARPGDDRHGSLCAARVCNCKKLEAPRLAILLSGISGGLLSW